MTGWHDSLQTMAFFGPLGFWELIMLAGCFLALFGPLVVLVVVLLRQKNPPNGD